MFLIEPCCTQKHLPELRSKLGVDGTTFFHGYGDLSLAEILPVLLTRYSETEIMIVAPSLPNGAAKVLKQILEKEWPTIDGKRKLNTIAHMTLVTDLRKSKSPMASAWLGENPYPERLILRNVQQGDTAIILPDIALFGNINLTYGGHFTAIATKRVQTIAALKSEYEKL